MGARGVLLRAARYVALIVMALATLFPLLWVTSIAFMRSPERFAGTPPLWPDHPTLVNMVNIVHQQRIGHYFLNSLIVAVATTPLSVLVAGLAGYALAQAKFRGHRLVSWLVMFAVLVPNQALVLPLFEMFSAVHLINHYAALVLPAAANAVSIVLIQAYARAIPKDILDAARIDGASEWRTFFAVVVPLMAPMLAAVAVLTFVVSWNDFMWPMIAMQKVNMQTLPVALASIDREHYQNIGLMAAGATVAILPMMVVFLASQRYYLRAVSAGSLTD